MFKGNMFVEKDPVEHLQNVSGCLGKTDCSFRFQTLSTMIDLWIFPQSPVPEKEKGTLPETNSSPLKISYAPKRTWIFQPLNFRGVTKKTHFEIWKKLGNPLGDLVAADFPDEFPPSPSRPSASGPLDLPVLELHIRPHWNENPNDSYLRRAKPKKQKLGNFGCKWRPGVEKNNNL